MAVSWRPDQLDPPRPVSVPVMRAMRQQAVQSSRRRKGTLCRAVCPHGAAREDWRNHGTHSRMRRARGQPGPRRVDDGDRDAGVHEGEPKQGLRPHLVGRDRPSQSAALKKLRIYCGDAISTASSRSSLVFIVSACYKVIGGF